MRASHRDVVFLLHGINTDLDGEGAPVWYDTVRTELGAFFEVVAIRYRAYDGILGIVRVPSYRGAGILAGLIGLAIAMYWRFALAAIAAGVFIFVVGILVSTVERTRRARTADDIAAQMGRHARKGIPHHVIAHSFGTFLLVRALRRDTVSLVDVILTGSVLQRRYEWRGLWTFRPDGARLFQRVRNEWSAKDRVSWWAGAAGWLTGCGSAGAAGGFTASPEPDAPPVHESPTPWGPCSSSSERCFQAPIIHNVALGEYGHSGTFLSEKHARDLWLPALWSFEPLAFDDFVCRCAEIFRLRDDGFPIQAAELCEAMLDEPFPWFGTKRQRVCSIREVAVAAARFRGVSISDQELLGITQTTVELVAFAWQSPVSHRRRLGYPRRALKVAIADTLGGP